MQKIFNNFKLNSRAIVTLCVILCLFALAFAFTATLPSVTEDEPIVANAASAINSSNFRSAIQNNGSTGTISGEYELAGNANVEWYDCTGNQNDPDYRSAIWIPVKRK